METEITAEEFEALLREEVEQTLGMPMRTPKLVVPEQGSGMSFPSTCAFTRNIPEVSSSSLTPYCNYPLSCFLSCSLHHTLPEPYLEERIGNVVGAIVL